MVDAAAAAAEEARAPVSWRSTAHQPSATTQPTPRLFLNYHERRTVGYDDLKNPPIYLSLMCSVNRGSRRRS